ncbi:Cephalosporin-C deacetylase [Microbacterium lemovicicum]|uniref:Cephalosporin-C deacetylase n=1 Tax=Microbacterium lemovicicum TaxID=1072463 RepID=A0A3S9WBM7_9MICO|nr:acetylxylan esterase [Microbacterium lemovicicum]AZS37454.1 Cephalosporin-C deacetylase [Microbacterium lemovicicum]
MPQYDLPLEELRDYRPTVRRRDDFAEFWSDTLAESRAATVPASTRRVDSGLRLVDTSDLEFPGFGGERVRGWVHVPAGAAGPLPAVVEFIGYGGGRKLAWQDHAYAEAGYVHVVMDTRGQGWWAVGATADHGAGEGIGSIPGQMTRGILDPADYFYRRVFTDAALLVDAVRELPQVDETRVAVTGGSQGGGIAIAAAALSEGLVGAAVDVPFLCHFERAVALTDARPYGELVDFFARYRDDVERAFDTLSYFDAVNLAPAADVPALFSVALRDDICPPSTVFAAYNAWAGPRDIAVYPFNGHEGGGEHHMLRRLAFFREVFGA